jgi:hypothetical protein
MRRIDESNMIPQLFVMLYRRNIVMRAMKSFMLVDCQGS